MTFNELQAWVERCAPLLAENLRDEPIVAEVGGTEFHIDGAAAVHDKLCLYTLIKD